MLMWLMNMGFAGGGGAPEVRVIRYIGIRRTGIVRWAQVSFFLFVVFLKWSPVTSMICLR